MQPGGDLEELRLKPEREYNWIPKKSLEQCPKSHHHLQIFTWKESFLGELLTH